MTIITCSYTAETALSAIICGAPLIASRFVCIHFECSKVESWFNVGVDGVILHGYITQEAWSEDLAGACDWRNLHPTPQVIQWQLPTHWYKWNPQYCGWLLCLREIPDSHKTTLMCGMVPLNNCGSKDGSDVLNTAPLPYFVFWVQGICIWILSLAGPYNRQCWFN